MSFITDEQNRPGLCVGDEDGPEVAVAIRRCLESLVKDAQRSRMNDLAEFLSLAVLAADDAARTRRAASDKRRVVDLASRRVVGSC